jgi:hypothetical protein
LAKNREDKENGNIVKDLQGRNCAVCTHLSQTAFDYLSRWISAFASDEETQKEYAEVLGFCPFHTWQLVDIASARGLSRGYQVFLKRISGKLEELAGNLKNISEKIFALIQGSEGCPLCSRLRETESAYIRQLILFLQEPEGLQAYSESSGVCLRHLGLLVNGLSSQDRIHFLISKAAADFVQIIRDLENYTKKCDSLRRDLITPDEKNAYLRVLIQMIGDRMINPILKKL